MKAIRADLLDFTAEPAWGSTGLDGVRYRPDHWLLIDAQGRIRHRKMGATHKDCAVSDIVEDKARKLVTTPAYMLAQSISEAASGINKLVDRVLELTHENDA